MPAFLKVHELKQQFGAQEVLKGVSFEVERGEVLALIGGSGAGKSVILKHLDGLLDPLDGYVEIKGRRISNIPEKEKREIRKSIGFMFQQGALFDSLTVGENVAFPLREAGIKDPAEIARRVTDALASVGLTGHEDKMPANLSGGMIKRVAVARAIIMEPECLLYDEPTAGLDPIVTDSISYLIRDICKNKGITSIIVTHDMPGVTRVADKIVYLRQGAVYWTGTPQELLRATDPVLQQFLYGESGQDWSALHGLNVNLQQVLLQRAEQDCLHHHTPQT